MSTILKPYVFASHKTQQAVGSIICFLIASRPVTQQELRENRDPNTRLSL